ncbi:MAG: dTMP kinase [Euryarchaeota archaeon]|nr:dTMP kinase [Euryarchaeota archaeon]
MKKKSSINKKIKGSLIVLEGLDQSGKETQIKLLAKRLENEKYRFQKIAFPDYSTPIGKEIEAFLQGKRAYYLRLRHMLYAANRWEKKEDIESWLNQGKIVIIDRYSQSNLAYGLAHGLSLQWLFNLEKGLPRADLAIVIDVSPQTSYKRKQKNRDIYEMDLDYLTKVREAYLKLSRKFKWAVIDGEKSVKNVHAAIWKIVNKFLV